ncbi:MAG: DUF4339 domain-containing protein [Sedimentisphaerales bacterium]|nr:DUF4339 domain-containing protein [Sedimentisphaerales bacterium]
MNENAAVWFLVGDDGQPKGPYRTAEVLDALRRGQVDAERLCWHRGMTSWQPLAQVEPFAGAIAEQRTAARGRARRVAVATVAILCLVAGGVAACFVVMGPAEVRQGRKLIARGYYKEAAAMLTPYLARKPLDNKARYLLAISQINEYATADTGGGLISISLEMGSALEGARQSLSKLLVAEPGWREKARADLATAAARIPPGAVDALARSLAIARLRAELNLADKRELAAEVMSQLSPAADESGRGILRNEVVVLQILEWDPSLSERIVELALRTTTGSQQELRMVLPTLQRWANQRPAMASLVAAQLLSKATSLQDAGRSAEAKAALSKALEIDPQMTVTEEHAFLCVKLMDPDDAKLARCQYFLKQWPQSRHRADVLVVIVKDATSVFDRYGRWQQAKAQPYLNAGREATAILLEEFPKTERLDGDVYELAKRVADNKQYDAAIALVSDLQTAIPDSAIKLQMADSVAQWRQRAGKGTLAPEFDMLAQQVERELKIMTVSAGGAVRALRETPRAVHVVQIADGCTLDRFNLEEKEVLQQWVAAGGILWANNDVLSLFDIQNGSTYHVGGDCQPAAVAEICPVLTGCQSVVVQKGVPAAFDLRCRGRGVVQLLTVGEAGNQICSWSLVPYGQGWISDVKTVDTSKGDGARFWLNFRLFCLGRSIPGAPASPSAGSPLTAPTPQTPLSQTPAPQIAPIQRAVPSSSGPVRITDTGELEKALADSTGQGMLWVSLSKVASGTDNIKKLQEWVQDGGVLWADTDLAEAFGFGNVRTVPLRVSQGGALVAAISHPVTEGLQGRSVSFELSASGGVISGPQQDIFSATSNVMPLLVQFDRVSQGRRFTTIAYVFCGVRRCGKGVVVFRPARIDVINDTGRLFEERLLSFSLEAARGR